VPHGLSSTVRSCQLITEGLNVYRSPARVQRVVKCLFGTALKVDEHWQGTIIDGVEELEEDTAGCQQGSEMMEGCERINYRI
jgi:hypothetical protein